MRYFVFKLIFMGKKYFRKVYGGNSSYVWERTSQPQKIIKWFEKLIDFEQKFSQSIPCLIPP